MGIINPLGMIVASHSSPGVMVSEIDLSYAVLPWSRELDNGRLFTRAYGDRAGCVYSETEDNGIFWSNSPAKPISDMVNELKLREMREEILASENARRKALSQ
jgi:hypothetical protein